MNRGPLRNLMFGLSSRDHNQRSCHFRFSLVVDSPRQSTPPPLHTAQKCQEMNYTKIRSPPLNCPPRDRANSLVFSDILTVTEQTTLATSGVRRSVFRMEGERGRHLRPAIDGSWPIRGGGGAPRRGTGEARMLLHWIPLTLKPPLPHSPPTIA